MAGSVNMMMAGMGDQKRRNEATGSHLYIAAGHGVGNSAGPTSCGLTSTKRAKTTAGVAGAVPLSTSRTPTSTTSPSAREKKDKIGERVAALQQLVSPYGKTDTASVLQETTCYIKFLHEQVQKMSAPFLQTPPIHPSQGYSLRSRGLCLVPVDCTATLASSNGADIWAPSPTNTTSSSSSTAGTSGYGHRF